MYIYIYIHVCVHYTMYIYISSHPAGDSGADLGHHADTDRGTIQAVPFLLGPLRRIQSELPQSHQVSRPSDDYNSQRGLVDA